MIEDGRRIGVPEREEAKNFYLSALSKLGRDEKRSYKHIGLCPQTGEPDPPLLMVFERNSSSGLSLMITSGSGFIFPYCTIYAAFEDGRPTIRKITHGVASMNADGMVRLPKDELTNYRQRTAPDNPTFKRLHAIFYENLPQQAGDSLRDVMHMINSIKRTDRLVSYKHDFLTIDQRRQRRLERLPLYPLYKKLQSLK